MSNKHLINAQKMASQDPQNISVPSAAALAKLKIGDFVKVGVIDEKFWCEILSFAPKDKLVCRVDNKLIWDKKYGIYLNSTIEIKRSFIFEIIKSKKKQV